ncbi:hypothetical protein BDZ85DRAFT_260318 [Elsinoe ampelina]|uniref:Uncharacterized protein n=1 Tax=Elsinoe ampelina TaxID=302913 RepID=A0A6A6GE80_9PEZI|nr:hypothetical protein BDZ85DRAFT_260318 [Elsinoe ampelina]
MPSVILKDERDGAGDRQEKIFHVVKDLPFELRQHVSSYLQEQLYAPAFEALQNMLISGADHASGNQQRTFLPSDQVLALASTLVVHPLTTTRLQPSEKPVAADLALRYLRHLTIIPPLQSGYADAFVFASSDPERQSRLRRRRSIGDVAANSLGEFDGRLTTRISTDDSVFARAEDFWSVVGWAFNCSIKHPRRWERWQIWLGVMLNLLQQDLDDRLAETNRQKSDSRSNDKLDLLHDALLSKYVKLRSNGRGEKKRIMRAILADGSKRSMNEFKEVWHNETLPPKREEGDSNDKILDIENDQWGDYMDLDLEEEEEVPELATRRSSRRGGALTQCGDDEDYDDVDETDLAHTVQDWGGITSINLRRRILGLLVRYTEVYPIGFVRVYELFDVANELIRPLPLSIFTHFVSPTKAYMNSSDAHCSLVLDLFRTIVGDKAITHRKGELDQDDLEKYYLPATASGPDPVDNAKVSIMVETLMRLMWKEGRLVARSSLSNAVAQGRQDRLGRLKSDSRRKTETRTRLATEAVEVIENSALRMAVVLDVINATTT